VRFFAVWLLGAGAGFPALFAQSSPALPGCEARIEIRRAIDEGLAEKPLANMKFAERVRFRRQVLEDLIAQYPREVEAHRLLIRTTKQEDTETYPALVDRYQKEAERHPRDPLALYLAGLALSDKDTRQSILLLEQSRSLAPNFPWPALELASIYSPGTKRADKQKAEKEIAAFFTACPSSSDAEAQARLSRAGASDLQARVAAALRSRLAGEIEPRRLAAYDTLWALEFRTHPPKEHDALRQQVRADLKRLEAVNPKPDAAWLVFLKDGYMRGGAAPETVAAMEDRVIKAFPHSEEAYRIVSDRWDKSHPEPEDSQDAARWDQYHREYHEALGGWIARFTDSQELQHVARLESACDDPVATAEKGLGALDDFLSYMAAYRQPSFSDSLRAAGCLVDHKWQPQRVFGLMREFDKLMDEWHTRVIGDNLSAGEGDMWAFNETMRRQIGAGYVLVAARLAEQPDEAMRVKPFVERDLPARSNEFIESLYWQNRARLAALEGSQADALTYYQKALQTRKKPPQPHKGRVRDPLLDEARALWGQLGGTETAWNIWSKPPAARIQELAESGWRKPAKDMPAFELADLSGKTWRLKDLGGRAVLINVWATWCGPCQAELPHLERLYKKVKDRTDLQILTLTIDDDTGLVAPFMKEKGYTFPVLPATSFVTGLLDLVSIPRNWIVDPKGVWRWTGAPGGPDAEWEEAMLRQLESVK
jgi:thiol-disulfide isomerase/thioredoxin